MTDYFNLENPHLTLRFSMINADAPARRRSMLIALEDLHLDHLWVVYPGDQAYDLEDRISVIPVADLTRLSAFVH